MKPRPKSTPKLRLRLLAAVLILLVIGMGLFVLDNFREEEKSARQWFRKTVAAFFPDQAAEVYASFGLQPYNAAQESGAESEYGGPDIVLIHGLDDPGKIWMNLAPTLAAQPHRVWIMSYPNDQPVNDSAQFFSAEMAELRARGVRHVAIVAHSMGGLVSREMLTDPRIDYIGRMKNGQLPVVDSLIMVGTPNKGSEIARLRGFTELRDQLTRFAEGDGHWLGGILDGAGEAKLDLLPGSRFLETLNARPHPAGIGMLVIAGIASPWDDGEIKSLAQTMRGRLPESMQAIITDLEQTLQSMTQGLGDGLVTIDSARLEGVPLLTVPGTHLSMIRNISESSDRIPPAVPIIIEHINRLLQGKTAAAGHVLIDTRTDMLKVF